MSLIAELKRRNVFRVAAAYVVGAWLLLQVADLVLENIGAPEWVIQSLMLLLGLGFVAALVISWVYELTPDGIRKESEITPDQSIVQHTAKKLDVITLLAVAALIALLAWQQFFASPATPPPADTAVAVAKDSDDETAAAAASPESMPSIAVLPFADLSPDEDQRYFSDGIAEEILNVLTRVDGLKVASRTSSFQFRQNQAVGIPAIARELQVRHVLEGSVRKAGETIRITAQLIDSNSDGHLWSETFDRTLTTENVFAIQDEIASAIVQRLGATLGDGSAGGPGPVRRSADTQNIDAYEAFLKGQQLFMERSFQNIPMSIDALEQAVAADPAFARAWSHLAAVYGVATSWGVSDRDYNALARQAARRAIDLDPELSLPHAVLGMTESYRFPADYASILAHYGRALELDPKDTSALLWRGVAYLDVGYFEQSMADTRRCLDLDPAYENCRRFHALGRLLNGDIDTALALFEQGVQKGALSQFMPFAITYAQQGDRRAALLASAWGLSQSGNTSNIQLVYRAMTDPEFVFDGPVELATNLSSMAAFLLKQYDQVTAQQTFYFHWLPQPDDFRRTPHFQRLLREQGVVQFWQEAGFPPQCRAVDELAGEQSFECD